MEETLRADMEYMLNVLGIAVPENSPEDLDGPDSMVDWCGVYQYDDGNQGEQFIINESNGSEVRGVYVFATASGAYDQRDFVWSKDGRQGPATIARSMSGGNQQKAIIAREVDKDPQLLVAVQPTRGLDVGAIEYIHKQIVAERDKGRAVLLVSLELDEVMNLSDRILVIYEGEIVGEFDPKKTTVEELGLYMAGAKKQGEAKA